MLGVCFGHQLIAQALGGEVAPGDQGEELGAQTMMLTEAGRRDALFHQLPENMTTMQSHEDVVTELPDGAARLASSRSTSCQAFALGTTIRAVQFHPEFTVEHMTFILNRERAEQEQTGVDVDKLIAELKPTEAARNVLQNFERFFMDRKRELPGDD